jgi:hypothetical protein
MDPKAFAMHPEIWRTAVVKDAHQAPPPVDVIPRIFTCETIYHRHSLRDEPHFDLTFRVWDFECIRGGVAASLKDPLRCLSKLGAQRYLMQAGLRLMAVDTSSNGD